MFYLLFQLIFLLFGKTDEKIESTTLEFTNVVLLEDFSIEELKKTKKKRKQNKKRHRKTQKCLVYISSSFSFYLVLSFKIPVKNSH